MVGQITSNNDISKYIFSNINRVIMKTVVSFNFSDLLFPFVTEENAEFQLEMHENKYTFRSPSSHTAVAKTLALGFSVLIQVQLITLLLGS